MLNAAQARKQVETEVKGTTVKACVPYKGGFLARVVFSSADEEEFDPFFMVNAHTGEVREFSIMSDGDPLEVAEAFESG